MSNQYQAQADIATRVRRLAIFFIGIGFYALVGEVLRQALLLEETTSTYLTVGVVVGIIGVLLILLLWYRSSDDEMS